MVQPYRFVFCLIFKFEDFSFLFQTGAPQELIKYHGGDQLTAKSMNAHTATIQMTLTSIKGKTNFVY